jgi:hypothetical protein
MPSRAPGPRTEEGTRISRRNALRHGLTAGTVIDGLEQSEDYRGFEAAIIADYEGIQKTRPGTVQQPRTRALGIAPKSWNVP